MKTVDTEIIIDKNGDIRFIYDDKLQPLFKIGKVKIRRVSYVEPTKNNKWKVDMTPIGNKKMKVFINRNLALTFEKNWLIKHNIPLPKGV